MFIETALKNNVIDEVCCNCNDISFDGVFREKMSDDIKNSKLRLKRLQLRDGIHSYLSQEYKKECQNKRDGRYNKPMMVYHFYNRGDDVPIWAVFETITLGKFADFTSCLNEDVRRNILKKLCMSISADTNYQLLSNSLYLLKDLRNAVAHNNIIFDTRFCDRGASKNVKQWLYGETGIKDIKFNYLIDYMILVCCLLKKLGQKKQAQDLISRYKQAIDKIYNDLPINIYTKIISSDALYKIEMLKKYIK